MKIEIQSRKINPKFYPEYLKKQNILINQKLRPLA